MFDLIIAFGSWYWNSKAWLWISIILMTPIATWEVIKRMPNNSKLNKRKKSRVNRRR